MKNKNKKYLKIGDRIKVIAGDQKGIIGNILSIITKNQQSLVNIEGVIPRIKYSKNTKEGESKKQELPIFINISNIMLWDKEKLTVSRIGYKIQDGKKLRIFKKSGNVVN